MFKYLLSAVLIFSFSLHPIHVSICEIEYDQTNKAMEITLRIFLDDLEKELRLMKNQPEMDITDLKADLDLDVILKEYLSKHFQINVNEKIDDYNFLGHEIEGDAVFCYMEVSKVKKLKSVQVFNSALTDLYEDQTNLVHIEVNEKIKSLKLTRLEKQGKIVYQ